MVERMTPPRRLIVAWLAVRGYSRKEIARATGLSIHTVSEHIDLMMSAYGVSGILALLRVLAA
jgi:DNA-binding NarL/FixJ family response regulator